MPLETFSRDGAALIPRRLPSAQVRTLMPYPMPGNTTAPLEFLAVSKRSARCSEADSVRRTRSSFSCSRRKNQRVSESDAWGADCCRKHGFAFLEMVSRAYDDSVFVARIAPTGMLFIPCRNGYSHRPDEYAAPEDIARGALVLAESLAKLCSSSQ